MRKLITPVLLVTTLVLSLLVTDSAEARHRRRHRLFHRPRVCRHCQVYTAPAVLVEDKSDAGGHEGPAPADPPPPPADASPAPTGGADALPAPPPPTEGASLDLWLRQHREWLKARILADAAS